MPLPTTTTRPARPRLTRAAVLLMLASATPAAAQTLTPAADTAPLPVTGVTLYTSGVGYFERGGEVSGEAAETLLFPVGQVNDVLKSLVLLDTGGGGIRPVTYGASDPVGRQLQAFSVDVNDNPDPATLLNRMRGADVTVSYADAGGPKTATGTIVGVQTQTVALPGNAGTTQASFLTLLAGGGLKTIPLASVTDTQINDAGLRAELASALSALSQSRDSSKRPVTLHFAGAGRRHVLIGYLTEAPLWQSSYRLVLGKEPLLQGWATVQNTGQDDWNAVRLTLVSGRPISFIQDLYTPLYVSRPVVEAAVDASPTPQTYGGNLNADESITGQAQSVSTRRDTGTDNPVSTSVASAPMVISKPAPAMHLRPGLVPSHVLNGAFGTESLSGNSLDVNGQAQMAAGAMRDAVKTSGGRLGTALFTYAIKTPVSIPRQKSAMIPFVAGAVSAQSVSIFNPAVQSDHPLLGARIKNTTGLHLMGGPLTVFDEDAAGSTAYVGDALVDDTEPGQTRLVSYAVDLGLDAHGEPGRGLGRTTTIKLYNGNLVVKSRQETSQIYTVKNNSDKARLVVVEHPYHGANWELLEPVKADEQTGDLRRFDLPVPAHASKKLVVRESYPDVSQYGLLDADTDTLLVYVSQAEASPAVKTALRDILDRRTKVSGFESRIAALGGTIQNLGTGQTRIRNNMRELDRASALYKRYVAELDAQETRLNALAAQKATVQTELAQAQAALNSAVAREVD